MVLGESSRVTIQLEPVEAVARSSDHRVVAGHGGRLVTDPDPVFEALADPTRRAVIRALAHEGRRRCRRCRGSCRSRDRPSPSIWRAAGRRAGRGLGPGARTRYTFTPRPLTDAMDWIVDVGAGWDTASIG